MYNCLIGNVLFYCHSFAVFNSNGLVILNMLSFSSLLLRRECCTFSNGEYVKAGLAELELWCCQAKEEVFFFLVVIFICVYTQSWTICLFLMAYLRPITVLIFFLHLP